MPTVKEIEAAISKLPKYDLVALREWFADFEARIWDEQFENDAKSGKLDKLAKKAVEDYQSKECHLYSRNNKNLIRTQVKADFHDILEKRI